MIRRRRCDFWWIALFWFIPLLGLLTCYIFAASPWLWILAGFAFMSGLIQHMADLNQYSDWKKRLAEIEGDLVSGCG